VGSLPAADGDALQPRSGCLSGAVRRRARAVYPLRLFFVPAMGRLL
jgi:hypothetical protein